MGIYDIPTGMDIMTDATLLSEIEAFIKLHDMKPSKFGREAMADPALIMHLRDGRSLTLRNAEKVCRFMREYRRVSPSQAAA